MSEDKDSVKQFEFFKKKPKNCDNYIFSDSFPWSHFIVSGPCQIVIRNRRGNWFQVEILKDKETKVVRAPKKNKSKENI